MQTSGVGQRRVGSASANPSAHLPLSSSSLHGGGGGGGGRHPHQQQHQRGGGAASRRHPLCLRASGAALVILIILLASVRGYRRLSGGGKTIGPNDQQAVAPPTIQLEKPPRVVVAENLGVGNAVMAPPATMGIAPRAAVKAAVVEAVPRVAEDASASSPSPGEYEGEGFEAFVLRHMTANLAHPVVDHLSLLHSGDDAVEGDTRGGSQSGGRNKSAASASIWSIAEAASSVPEAWRARGEVPTALLHRRLRLAAKASLVPLPNGEVYGFMAAQGRQQSAGEEQSAGEDPSVLFNAKAVLSTGDSGGGHDNAFTSSASASALTSSPSHFPSIVVCAADPRREEDVGLVNNFFSSPEDSPAAESKWSAALSVSLDYGRDVGFVVGWALARSRRGSDGFGDADDDGEMGGGRGSKSFPFMPLQVLRGINIREDSLQKDAMRNAIATFAKCRALKNEEGSLQSSLLGYSAAPCTVLVRAERVLPRNIKRSLKYGAPFIPDAHYLSSNGDGESAEEEEEDKGIYSSLSHQSAQSLREMMDSTYSLLTAPMPAPDRRSGESKAHPSDGGPSRLYAQSAEGLLNGLRTLMQLTLTATHSQQSHNSDEAALGSAKHSGDNGPVAPSFAIAKFIPFRTPCLYIRHDAPKLPWRGQHVDASRHFVSMPTMLRLVSEMGKLKMNRLHWHLSDDQGWRIESRLFPRLHVVGSRRGESLSGAKAPKYLKSLAYMPSLEQNGVGESPEREHGSDEASKSSSWDSMLWAEVADGARHWASLTNSNASFKMGSFYSPPNPYPQRSHYSVSDSQYLVAYALARGIVVVPEVDLPAHAQAFVAGMSDEQRRRKQQGAAASDGSGNNAASERKSAAEANTLHSSHPHRIHSIGGTVSPAEGNSDCGPDQPDRHRYRAHLLPPSPPEEGEVSRIVSTYSERLRHFETTPQAINCMGGSFGMVYPTHEAAGLIKLVLREMSEEIFFPPPASVSVVAAAAAAALPSSSSSSSPPPAFFPPPRQSYFHIGGDQAEFVRSQIWDAFFDYLDATKDGEDAMRGTMLGTPLMMRDDLAALLLGPNGIAASLTAKRRRVLASKGYSTLQAALTDSLVNYLTLRGGRRAAAVGHNAPDAVDATSGGSAAYPPSFLDVPRLLRSQQRLLAAHRHQHDQQLADAKSDGFPRPRELRRGDVLRLPISVSSRLASMHDLLVGDDGGLSQPPTVSSSDHASPLVSSAIVWDDTLLDLNTSYVPPMGRTLVMLWRSDGINLRRVRARIGARHPQWLEALSDLSAVVGDADVSSVDDELAEFYLRLWREAEAPASSPSSSFFQGSDASSASSASAPRIILTPKTHSYFDYVQHSPMDRNRVLPMQSPAPWVGYPSVPLTKTLELHALAEEAPPPAARYLSSLPTHVASGGSTRYRGLVVGGAASAAAAAASVVVPLPRRVARRQQLQQQRAKPATVVGDDDPIGLDPFALNLVLGVQGCVWTELLTNAADLEYQLFPRLLAVADAGWSRRALVRRGVGGGAGSGAAAAAGGNAPKGRQLRLQIWRPLSPAVAAAATAAEGEEGGDPAEGAKRASAAALSRRLAALRSNSDGSLASRSPAALLAGEAAAFEAAASMLLASSASRKLE